MLCFLSSENLANPPPKKKQSKAKERKAKEQKKFLPQKTIIKFYGHKILAGTDMEKFPNICLCTFNSLINLMQL